MKKLPEPTEQELAAFHAEHATAKIAGESLISAVMYDNERMADDGVSTVDREWLWREPHRFIWDAITALADKGKSISVASIAQTLGKEGLLKIGGIEELRWLNSKGSRYDPDEAALILRDEYNALQRRNILTKAYLDFKAGNEGWWESLGADYQAYEEGTGAGTLSADLDDAWLNPAEWMDSLPPDEPSLLKLANGRTFLEEGECGMLAGIGSAGKSYLMLQLAVSVACGHPWLDKFGTSEPGPVFIAHAEDKPSVIWRRVYYIVKAMGLTDPQRELVRENLQPASYKGCAVGLLASQARGDIAPSPFYNRLRQRLERDGRAWRLIVFDPLSRFVGRIDTNSDVDATLFVQTIETLTKMTSRPAVLVTHHMNKSGYTGETDASAQRGSSGFTDGFRWQCNLDLKRDKDTNDETIMLRPVKANSCELPEPMELRRGAGGVLEVKPKYDVPT